MLELTLVGVLVTACLGTGGLRRLALSWKLVDVPNARSSHSMPTPRGGGMAIVLSTAAAFFLLWWQEELPTHVAWSLIGGGSIVALVGWLDDRGHVPVLLRLIVHFVGAASALTLLGGVEQLPLPDQVSGLDWAARGLALLYLVWLLNLFNFMDGIDGIAAIEAVSVCLGGTLLMLTRSSALDNLAPPLVVASATAGFLVWNFPRAKIFLGDAGSGFLGLTLGLLSLYAAGVQASLFWGWVVLLGTFVVDSTVTLLHRAVRGEPLYKAHRSHAYQRAALELNSHVIVSLFVGAVNVMWLLPVAMMVALGKVSALVGVVVAYAPLVALAIRYRAGAAE